MARKTVLPSITTTSESAHSLMMLMGDEDDDEYSIFDNVHDLLCVSQLIATSRLRTMQQRRIAMTTPQHTPCVFQDLATNL